MAIFCEECGTQLNEGAKFCKKCGASMEKEPPVASPSIAPPPAPPPPVPPPMPVFTPTVQQPPPPMPAVTPTVQQPPQPAPAPAKQSGGLITPFRIGAAALVLVLFISAGIGFFIS